MAKYADIARAVKDKENKNFKVVFEVFMNLELKNFSCRNATTPEIFESGDKAPNHQVAEIHKRSCKSD